MDTLSIDLKYCYGITALKETFDYSKSHTNLIYASNGSMKTSLTNTFKRISQKLTPEEKLFGHTPCCIIENDSSPINADSVFVIEPFDEQFLSKSISNLLVNQEMKAEYDVIYNDILTSKEKLISLLKKESKVKKEDVEKTMLIDFGESDFFSLLNSLVSDVADFDDFGALQYQILFDQKVVDILKDKSVSDNFKQYIEKYNELVASMKYYKKGGFNPIRADNVVKTLEKEKYFEAENSVLLNGLEQPIKSHEAFASKLEQDKNKILDNADLTRISETIINSVASVKSFQEILEAHPELAVEFSDVDTFKKKIWKSYLKNNQLQLKEFLDLYNNGKQKMKDIEQRARIEETKWYNVKNIFKQRFDVPFEIEIKDQVNTILGTKNPNIVFIFKDKESDVPIEHTKESIQSLRILSQGERRALYLLYVIFEVENRRSISKETLFIIDDIADSFDYKNKYAIIEYLKDMHEEAFFRLLILTHNFDFYRTLQSRVIAKEQWNNSYIAVKNDKSIELIKGGSKEITNPFEYWKKHLHNDDCMLIASIPFLRNIIEYKEGNKHSDYILLTSLLHIKKTPDSYSITLSELESVYKKYLANIDFKLGSKIDQLVIDLIYDNANSLVAAPRKETAEIQIKVALSIAIRLKAEEFMWSKISDTSNIKGTQTGILFDRYKKQYAVDKNEVENIKTLGSVNLMTPENIHLNSFMYEPILDMSNHHLFELYDKVRLL